MRINTQFPDIFKYHEIVFTESEVIECERGNQKIEDRGCFAHLPAPVRIHVDEFRSGLEEAADLAAVRPDRGRVEVVPGELAYERGREGAARVAERGVDEDVEGD